MGINQSSEFLKFCPFCEDTTDHISVIDNEDESYTFCLVCEENTPIKINLDEPFIIGKKLFFIHLGYDEGFCLREYKK